MTKKQREELEKLIQDYGTMLERATHRRATALSEEDEKTADARDAAACGIFERIKTLLDAIEKFPQG